ncbi:MAG: ATP-binding protein [Bacteroides sp.]|uniref:ATP-binding protein n=1 Tax=Bacteroides sp. TaxID=29523 RepID=UPI002FC87822
MGLIKRPTELTVKSTLSALIYGQPGMGKTTLACSAPNPVLFDYDGGIHRVNAAHRVPTVQITSWEETDQVLKSEEIKDFATIVIDTAGKMLSFMDKYIMATNPKMRKADGTLSLQGYGVRKQMFINFVNQVSLMGKSVLFVAHEREEKVGDEKQIRPEIGGSSAGDLIKELDLVGYMEAIGKDRTISFDPCQKFYGKNTCNLQSSIKIPVVINEKGEIVGQNTFMSNIIDTYQKYQTKQTEKSSEYEALMEVIKENIEQVTDVLSANDAVKRLMDFDHIFDSKIQAGMLLNEKCKKLGLKYNKLSNSYEPIAA